MTSGALRVALIAAIAWGAFSFGAVYPWGYWPLCAVAVWVGVAGIVLVRQSLSGALPQPLAIALCAVAVAVSLQIVPLPAGLVRAVSPETQTVQARYELGIQNGQANPLSISPGDTSRAAAMFVAFALLLVGTACLLSVAGTTGLCVAIASIGSLLAITGIVQKALSGNKPLGFWTTLEGGNPYGPFVNRNHFAGWMLMVLPVSLGLLCATVSRETRGSARTARERLLWFGSPAASRVILLGFGIAIMTLSVFLTQSRAGMAGAAVVVGSIAVLAWRRYSGAIRIALVAAIAAILIGVIAWVGLDRVFVAFREAAAHDYAGRLGPWSDAWHVAQRFIWGGSGINTYRVAMIFFQQFNLEAFYSAAHNDYLQLFAEGGVLVGVPAAAAIVTLVLAIRKRFSEETSRSTFWIRAGAAIGLLAIAIQEIGDFSLQIPGNAFLFAVVCAIAIHRTPEPRRV